MSLSCEEPEVGGKYFIYTRGNIASTKTRLTFSYKLSESVMAISYAIGPYGWGCLALDILKLPNTLVKDMSKLGSKSNDKVKKLNK